MAFGYFALIRMVKASSTLHNRMLESILRSPMSFFDTTPIGRIMNRFSSDIDIMDDRLPLTFRLWAIQIFSMFATIIVVCINTPYFIAVLVPIMMVYVFLLVRLCRFSIPIIESYGQMRANLSAKQSYFLDQFNLIVQKAEWENKYPSLPTRLNIKLFIMYTDFSKHSYI